MFFFKKEVSHITYNCNLSIYEPVQKEINLYIREVAELKEGKLYELKLDNIEGIPNERLNLGYFYVLEDRIYKLRPTEENLNKIKSKQELPGDYAIVCQDKELKDSLGKNERGWHRYIEINGDKREFHSYNNLVETGYYESFTWEKSKGLIYYQSGFGAERDAIELQLNNPEGVNENLCGNREELIYSIRLKNSMKRLSICKSENNDYLIYRFGTKEKVEFEFPDNKKSSWDKFTYMSYLRGGGALNCGLDLNYLKFENKNNIYIIYDEFSAEANSTDVGIIIYDKNLKSDISEHKDRYFELETEYKETVIEGDPASIIGSLIDFRYEDRIKKENL